MCFSWKATQVGDSMHVDVKRGASFQNRFSSSSWRRCLFPSRFWTPSILRRLEWPFIQEISLLVPSSSPIMPMNLLSGLHSWLHLLVLHLHYLFLQSRAVHIRCLGPAIDIQHQKRNSKVNVQMKGQEIDTPAPKTKIHSLHQEI